MKNVLIREALKRAGMKQWELAEIMHIAETTLCVKLRKELPCAERQHILALIEEYGKR